MFFIPNCFLRLATVVLPLAAVTAVQAQANSPQPTAVAPSQAGAAVPRVVYRSAFENTPTGVETDTEDWRKANDAVGRFKRGHVDILKAEEAQAKAGASLVAVPAIAPPATAASGAAAAKPVHKH